MMNEVKSNLLDVLALFLNAAVFFATSYALIDEIYGRKWVAAVSLGLAVFYAAHVVLFFVRKLVDRELILSFAGLSAMFLALSAPLLLSSQWITLAWAIQAFVILWLAIQVESRFLRYAAYALYGLVLFRFGVIDFYTSYGKSPATDLTTVEYLKSLIERLTTFGVPIAAMAGAHWLLKRGTTHSDQRFAMNPANDIPAWLPESSIPHFMFGASVAMFCGFLHLEFNQSFGRFYDPLRLPALTFVWVGLCSYLLIRYLTSPSQIVLNLMTAIIGCVILKVLIVDLPDRAVGNLFLFNDYSVRDSGFRFLDFGAVITFLGWAYFAIPRHYETNRARITFGVAALLLLFTFLSLELNSCLYTFLPKFRSGGISILWSLFALGLLLGGILKHIRPLRYAGLALFSVVTLKVFFGDLADLDQFYRIVAFIVLGGVVICASVLYLKYRENFEVATTVDSNLDENSADEKFTANDGN